MKAAETIRRFRSHFADFPAGPIGERQVLILARMLLYDLADCADFAQLADGQYLRDHLDLAAWLRELEAAVALELERPNSATNAVEARVTPVAKVCHACGHAHKDRECGMEMGGAGVCKCDVEVVA